MSILFLLRWFPYFGGTEKITVSLANELAARGLDVHILGEASGNSHIKLDIDPKVRIHSLDCKINPKDVCSYVRSRNIDVMVCQCAYIGIEDIVEAVAASTRTKVVTVLHNDPIAAVTPGRPMRASSTPFSLVVKKLTWPLFKIWSARRYCRSFRRFIDASTRFLLLSEEYIPSIARLLRLDSRQSSKLLAIPNFLPDSDFESLSADAHGDDHTLSIPSKEKKIVYIGRVTEEQKRVSRLMEIWKSFSPSHPDWRLAVVGDGDALADCKAFAAANSLKRISFEGFSNDVDSFSRRAAVILLVSDHEGLPMTLIEAMRFGCIPVCYDSFLAISDIMADGQEGFVIPQPFDKNKPVKSGKPKVSEAESIAKTVDALSQLVADSELRKRMALASARRSRQFSSSSVVPRWIELFQSILE